MDILSLDDLNINNLKVLQSTKGFRFGIDAVLLANYAIPKGNCLDIGSGCGIIPVLMMGKNKVKHMNIVELQKYQAKIIKHNMWLNDFNENEYTIYNIDIAHYKKYFTHQSIDTITCNPPYQKHGRSNLDPSHAISRLEKPGIITNIIVACKNLLKNNGNLYMIHRPSRLAELIHIMKSNALEPKEIRLIHPKMGKAPNLVLIKATKGAKEELKFLSPLYIYNEDGSYTDEILRIYGID